jgi:hypothetical protein
MFRNFSVAGDVLQTSKLVRKNRRQQVLRFHSLQGSWHFMATTLARQSESTGRVPSPADPEHRRIKQRLG